MNEHRFDNFRVDAGNLEAFETCRRVAGLTEELSVPLLLHGPHGAGKTHLLWSIVHQLRDENQSVSLALVTATEFPLPVRGLIDNPAPIQGERPAIFLVDGLEQFQQDAQILETILLLFLEQGHTVVLTSAEPVKSLTAFSAAFHAMMASSKHIEMSPPESTATDVVPETTDLEGELAVLRFERDSLAKELELQKALLSCAEHAEPSDADSMKLQAEHDQEVTALNERIDALERSETALGEERDRLLEETAKLSQSGDKEQEDFTWLKQERDAAETLLETARREQGQLRTELDTLRGREQALRADLEAAHKQVGIQTAEIDALREQVRLGKIAAQRNIDHLQERLLVLESALSAAREWEVRHITESQRMRDGLREVLDRLQQLEEFSLTVPEWQSEQHPDLAVREMEEPLFDLEPYEQDTPHIPEERITLPGAGEGLQRAIEAILEREETPPQNDTPA